MNFHALHFLTWRNNVFIIFSFCGTLLLSKRCWIFRAFLNENWKSHNHMNMLLHQSKKCYLLLSTCVLHVLYFPWTLPSQSWPPFCGLYIITRCCQVIILKIKKPFSYFCFARLADCLFINISKHESAELRICEFLKMSN